MRTVKLHKETLSLKVVRRQAPPLIVSVLRWTRDKVQTTHGWFFRETGVSVHEVWVHAEYLS